MKSFFRLFLLSALALVIAACESISVSRGPSQVEKPVPTPKPLPAKASHVVIEKGKRRLTAYAGKKELLSYKVALGQNPVGAKSCEGDYKTPEGHYRITNQKSDSHFYRSLRISYPEPSDVARARKLGCKPGGNIAIHGLENGYDWVGHTHSSVDWTKGCIAVTNQEMDRLWKLLPVGTPVEIRP